MGKLIKQFKYHINNKNQFSALIGTLLEHYDASLYGFMAPILAPLFFPNIDRLNAVLLLILSYPITSIAKPAGAYIIGKIGDSMGRKKALQLSMVGMGISTACMGMVPTYETVGHFAPILFIITRMMQIFFISGESNGGAIFMLEHSHKEYYGRTSGFFCLFTAVGILIGASASYLVMYHGLYYWRLPYCLGVFTTMFAVYLRFKTTETPAFNHSKETVKYEHSNLKKHMLWLIIISSFARVMYMVPSLLIISYIPTITNIPTDQLMLIHCATLVIYAFIMPFMGIIADNIGIAKLLKTSILATIILIYPLFCLFYYNIIWLIIFAKIVLMILMAAFYCSLHPWYLQQFGVRQRYKMISLGYTIGSQIGASSPAIAMACFQKTGLVSSYAILIIVYGLMSLFVLHKQSKTQKFN